MAKRVGECWITTAVKGQIVHIEAEMALLLEIQYSVENSTSTFHMKEVIDTGIDRPWISSVDGRCVSIIFLPPME